MQKSLLLAAALLVASLATAQAEPPRHSQETVFKSRWMDRLWFSAVYTPKFMLSESMSLRSPVDVHKKTVHNYAFEAGYLLTKHVSLGLGVGYERTWLRTGGSVDLVPLFFQGHYFYGKRGGGLFNYARVGALLSADSDARSGFTGGAGVGYRLRLSGRFGVDLKAGYDFSQARINRGYWTHQSFDGAAWSRHSLSLGMGLVF